MIIPDKIYIPYYPNYDGIDTHLSDEWFEGKVIDHVEGWKEYIRKDALLEWIQEARAVPHENAIVRDLAFQEFINKLNSI